MNNPKLGRAGEEFLGVDSSGFGAQVIDREATQPDRNAARINLDELLKQKIVQFDPKSIEGILADEGLAPIE